MAERMEAEIVSDWDVKARCRALRAAAFDLELEALELAPLNSDSNPTRACTRASCASAIPDVRAAATVCTEGQGSGAERPGIQARQKTCEPELGLLKWLSRIQTHRGRHLPETQHAGALHPGHAQEALLAFLSFCRKIHQGNKLGLQETQPYLQFHLRGSFFS